MSLIFGAVDHKNFEIEFSAKCVPLAIMPLTLELARLADNLPADNTIAVQGVRIVGSELAMKDDGTVALMLTLEGGAQLPLEFADADLVKLRGQIDEAAELAGPTTRH